MVCVSAPSPQLHKPEYPYCGTTDCLQTNFGGDCGVLWSKNKLWECCCVKFVAVPRFVCPFCYELVSYINMHTLLFFDVVYSQVHCCHNMLFISLSLYIPCVVCVNALH